MSEKGGKQNVLSFIFQVRPGRAIFLHSKYFI